MACLMGPGQLHQQEVLLFIGARSLPFSGARKRKKGHKPPARSRLEACGLGLLT